MKISFQEATQNFQPPCRRIKWPEWPESPESPILQEGGYKKGFRLEKKVGNDRFERSFTQVFPDGSVSGHYVGYDYKKPNPEGEYRMQGTAWLSAVKKAHRQNCAEFREIYRLGMVIEDFGLKDDDFETAEKIFDDLSLDEKNAYRSEALKMQCEPMEILLRETTPGNNKVNFDFRQKKYYIESIPITPVKVLPSKGPTPRIYRFKPKVYPMKMNETIEEFKERKGL